MVGVDSFAGRLPFGDGLHRSLSLRIAVVGGTGFIGGAVSAAAEARSHTVIPVPAPRIVLPGQDAAHDAERWMDANGRQRTRLLEDLSACDVVVNAAGIADPSSSDGHALWGANAVLPAVLVRLASEAGVRRLVHVSSAAVQGRRDPLDESPDTAPVAPYGRSKAASEAVLLASTLERPSQVCVYRPTSVLGEKRSVTRRLVSLASLPAVVRPTPDSPVPVALVENVAAAVVHLCEADACPQLALHPWEGMTVGSLLRAFGARRMVAVPRGLLGAGLSLLHVAGSRSARVAAMARRLDLLFTGQGQEATALQAIGFSLPVGAEGYERLAQRVRAVSA